jgi:hypothetical protein
MPSQLSSRFSALTTGVGRAIRPAAAAEIRARGEQRRAHAIVGTTFAALAAVAVIVAVIGWAPLRDNGRGLGPASHGPTPIPTEISAQLHMPHEGEAGWTRDDDARRAGAIIMCGSVDVTLPGRIDAVTMTGPGNPLEQGSTPSHLTEQVLLYRTTAEAQQVLTGWVAQARGCGWQAGDLLGTAYGRNLITARTPKDAAIRQGVTLRDLMAGTRGNAVIVRYDVVGGVLMTSFDDAGFGTIADRLCTTMGLCESPPCWAYDSPFFTPSAVPCSSTPDPYGNVFPGARSEEVYPGGTPIPTTPPTVFPTRSHTPYPTGFPTAVDPAPTTPDPTG